MRSFLLFQSFFCILHTTVSDPKYYPHQHGDDRPEEEGYDDHLHEDRHPGFNYLDSEDDVELTRDSNKVFVTEEEGGFSEEKQTKTDIDHDSDLGVHQPNTNRPVWNFEPRMTVKTSNEKENLLVEKEVDGNLLIEKVIKVEETRTTKSSAISARNSKTATSENPPSLKPRTSTRLPELGTPTTINAATEYTTTSKEQVSTRTTAASRTSKSLEVSSTKTTTVASPKGILTAPPKTSPTMPDTDDKRLSLNQNIEGFNSNLRGERRNYEEQANVKTKRSTETSERQQRKEEQTMLERAAVKDLGETFTATFQADGYYSATSYGKLKAPLQQDLWNFTLCFRIKMFHRRPKTYVMSYATEDNDIIKDNEMLISMNPAKKNLKFAKRDGKVSVRAPYSGTLQRWRFICVVYYYGKSVSVYVDGKFRASAPINIFKETRPIRGGGVFVLAQEQDDLGGEDLFDATQSYSGTISQVNIWNGLLSNITIDMFSNCLLSGPVNQLGNVVAWKLEDWEFFDAEVEVVKRASLCEEPRGLEDIVFYQLRSQRFYLRTCSAIGGKLPVYDSQGSFEEHYKAARSRFNSINKTAMSFQASKCFFRGTEARFWVGIKKNVAANKWTNPYTGEVINYEGAWYGDEPSDTDHDCAHVWTTNPKDEVLKSWYSSKCSDRSSCAICKLQDINKRLILKGLCEADYLEQVFDTRYFIFGSINSKLHFQGIMASHIFMDNNGQWRLESYNDKSKYAVMSLKDSTDSFPLGRKTWTVRKGICEMEDEQKTLTFSVCEGGMFTCDDGECIELTKKCNLEEDCSDGTDEIYCDNIDFSSGYRTSLAPRTDGGVKLFVNVSVSTFPTISTEELQFIANFELSLRWEDQRLKYKNLRNITNLNKIEQRDIDRMWKPSVDFKNAVEPKTTEVDDKTSMFIHKEHDPRAGSLRREIEADVFEGEWATIIMRKEYFITFECEFELRSYPFDTQQCQMVFRLRGVTQRYMYFAEDYQAITYNGITHLTEFTVKNISSAVYREPGPYSEFVVTILFARRSIYHILNVYLQTTLLNLTVLFTLFFDVTNFSDRIMVSLTVMLVVVTLQTQIQATLPPTAYYKLIDYWLVSSLIIIILIMLVHTVLAYRLKVEGDNIERTEGKRPRSSIAPSGPSGPQGPDGPDLLTTGRPITARSTRSWVLQDKDFPKTRRLNNILKYIILAGIALFYLIYGSIALGFYLSE